MSKQRSSLVVAVVALSLAPVARADESVTTTASPVADSSAGPAVGQWELIRVEHGITVQRRRVEGSGLREFRGRGVVDAPLASVLAVLEDEAERAQQRASCRKLEAGGPLHSGSAVLYDRTKAPWPVADRDVVLRADTAVDTSERIVRIDFVTTQSACVPPVPGVVRMPFVRGHYLLRPTAAGRFTDVEYQVHADPGGTLPRWTANLAARQLPYSTVFDLRTKASLPVHAASARSIAARPEYQALMSRVAAAN